LLALARFQRATNAALERHQAAQIATADNLLDAIVALITVMRQSNELHNLPGTRQRVLRIPRLTLMMQPERPVVGRSNGIMPKPRKGKFIMVKQSVITAFVVGLLTVSANAEPQTSRSFYNSRGSFSGSATTYGNNTSVYDARGRFDGSAIRNSDGTTSLYDRNGHFIGSSHNSTQPK
jgi:hypothetical protein